MLKSFYLLDSKLIETSMSTADAVIEPDVIGISFTDFHRTEECIEAGAAATRLVVPEIKKKLGLS
jgi:predicted acylesterase/phospholipase RssA